MTTIMLPPDLESRLAEEAQRRGTTLELLALDGLRKLFGPFPDGSEATATSSLFDFLTGHLGTIAGTAEPLSENCGQPFAEGLAEKQRQGRP